MGRRTGAAASSLAAMLAPLDIDDFLARYWLTTPLHGPGPSDRFGGLLTWPAFDDILRRHWRETFRFRLARAGRDLPTAAYADPDGPVPRVRAGDVMAEMRRGATLSFMGLDEVHPPAARLAEAFAAVFRADTQVNVYVGSRARHGLDLHRDDEQIFILQVDGPKRWVLYGPSVEGVHREALRRDSAPPPGAVFDQVLRPGDLLYIPRGCYHLVVPMNEPAMHLTIGLTHPRGIDLLRWLAERLRETPVAALDLPLHAGPADRRRCGEALRSALLEGLEEDLLDQYLAETGSTAGRRPVFGLPWAATPELLPPGRGFRLTLTASGRLIGSGDADGGSLTFVSGGRRYRFPAGMRWVLEPLLDGGPLAMDRLVDAAAGRLDEPAVRTLVGMLVAKELVAVSVPGR